MQDEGGAVDPVFLDRTGRRRRLFVAAGSAGGLLLLLAVVALIAGFTAAGPGSVPGFPGGDELRISRPDPAVSVRPRTTAPRTPGLRTPVTTGAVRRTADPVASVTTTPTSPAASSTSPTGTPTATTNPHRRVPTHTPNPHKSKVR
jgi:alpha-beta hydrolase superfamily lysophospholipase